MADDAAFLAGRRILVVEDDYLVAQVLIDLLERAGAEVLGPIGWIDEALAMVADPGLHVDGAILDVNLHGAKSYPIAEALAARSIPCVFTSGYGADALDPSYRDWPRCEKPFNQDTLLAILRDAVT